MKQDYSMEELLPIVAKLAEKYNAKESSSVSYDMAKQWMAAVLYCIAEFYKGESNLPSTVKRLSAMEAYEHGYQKVIEKFLKARMHFEKLQMVFHDYGNEAYAETVLKGMPAFFKQYDYNYNPQEHFLTLDYPVLSKFSSCGIDLIDQYLNAIWLEQEFLGKLSQEYIYHTLTEYDASYDRLFINLPEIVLQKLLIDSMEEQIDDLLWNGNLKQALYHRTNQLVEQRYDGKISLLNYLNLAIPDICTRIRVSRENNLNEKN